jgi:4a-hydroxytetrahydrobiopterin dehydratase
MKLNTMKCEPCQGGIPPLTEEVAKEYLQQIKGWTLIENSSKIKKEIKQTDFLSALSLVQKIGLLCEEEGHHPDITFGWGYVQIIFYTHKINGLHQNDFIIAAKVDRLLDNH